MNVVIIGAGVAGINTATKLVDNNFEGKHTFHYINDYRTNFQGKMTPREASVFFIYNEDQDIHYFYMK